MGQPDLYVAVMAGVVLSLFLGVGEIAALRRPALRVYVRWTKLVRSGRSFRVAAELFGFAALFALQAVVVAVLVAVALGGLNPRFTQDVSRQIRLETMRLRQPSGQGGTDRTRTRQVAPFRSGRPYLATDRSFGSVS